MASSTCPKCFSHHFEISENKLSPVDYQVRLVHCRVCGTVVGVMDCHESGASVDRLERLIEAIAGKLEIPLEPPEKRFP